MHAGQDPKVLLDMSAEEDLQAKMQEANFGTATSALTILRYAAFNSLPCGCCKTNADWSHGFQSHFRYTPVFELHIVQHHCQMCLAFAMICVTMALGIMTQMVMHCDNLMALKPYNWDF